MAKIRPTLEKATLQTPDLLKERLSEARKLLPDAFSENKLDVDKLKKALGELADDRPERYSFSWAGKRDAMRLLQIPAQGTLVPDKEQFSDFDKTENLIIDGENLETLKLLCKAYFGLVKMIYIDPPYNTGKDFVYPDNYADPLSNYLAITGQKDGDGNLLTSNPETSGRFHSSWLSMMYPRLFIARKLLSDDGVIFISIDDNEVHNLRMIMNEIFGEENFICQFVWKKKSSYSYLSKEKIQIHEYILAYKKNDEVKLIDREYSSAETVAVEPIFKSQNSESTKILRNGAFIEMKKNKDAYVNYVFKKGKYDIGKQEIELHNDAKIKNGILVNDVKITAKFAVGQKFLDENANKISISARFALYFQDNAPAEKELAARTIIANNEWVTRTASAFLKDLFETNYEIIENPKPYQLIQYLVDISTTKNSLVLDFFAGSGTTGHAVLAQNIKDGGERKFILVQLPEPTREDSEARKAGYKTISEICRERVQRVIAKMQKEDAQSNLAEKKAPDLGFKAFTLVESNIKAWKGVEGKDAKKYTEQMALYIDPLKSKWKAEDVIWEMALKEGFGLCSKIEKLPTKENAVYKVIEPQKQQSFYICLDGELKETAVRPLNLKKEDLFFCRDSALSDELAANLALQCRLKTI